MYVHERITLFSNPTGIKNALFKRLKKDGKQLLYVGRADPRQQYVTAYWINPKTNKVSWAYPYYLPYGSFYLTSQRHLSLKDFG